MHTHSHTQTHAHTVTFTHTHTHSHIRTHTHTHLSPQDHTVTCTQYLLMKFTHLNHRKVTAHIRIEHKESSRIASQDLVSEMVDTPGSTQGAVFL